MPDGIGSPSFVLRIDADRALVGDVDGGLLVVERDGRVVSIGVGAIAPRPLAERRIRAGTAAPDGGHLLLDARGLLHRWSGNVEATPRILTSTSPLGPVERAAMVASEPGEPFEVFVVTSSDARGGSKRRFARFDGQRWTRLDQAVHRGIYLPDVARAGPGRALAIGTSTRSVAAVSLYEAGVVRGVVLPDPGYEAGESAPTAALWHPKLGYVLVGEDGAALIQAGAGWRFVRAARETYFTRILFATEAGFVTGGGQAFNFDASIFDEFVEPDGLCGTERIYTTYTATHHVSLDADTEVVLDTRDFVAPLGVTILERVQRPAECSAPAP